jgi:hypothetical protein
MLECRNAAEWMSEQILRRREPVYFDLVVGHALLLERQAREPKAR